MPDASTAKKLSNPNGSHVPANVAIPNGTLAEVLGNVQVAWDTSRPVQGVVVKILDGPHAGQTLVIPRATTIAAAQ